MFSVYSSHSLSLFSRIVYRLLLLFHLLRPQRGIPASLLHVNAEPDNDTGRYTEGKEEWESFPTNTMYDGQPECIRTHLCLGRRRYQLFPELSIIA
jgi:hypothetical protein